MKKFFVLLLFMSFLVNAQKETSPITVGASFGMLSEIGSVKSEGFNSAFDLHVSKYVTNQVALSTNFTLASPMNGTNPYSKNGFGGSQLFYGANLDYQPTKNLFLKFSMNNYPR